MGKSSRASSLLSHKLRKKKHSFLFSQPSPRAPLEKMQTALAQRSSLAPLSAPRTASARRAPRVAAQAGARPLWLPGTKSPAHLTGTLAGDRGFDPLVSWLCFLGGSWCRASPAALIREERALATARAGGRGAEINFSISFLMVDFDKKNDALTRSLNRLKPTLSTRTGPWLRRRPPQVVRTFRLCFTTGIEAETR